MPERKPTVMDTLKRVPCRARQRAHDDIWGILSSVRGRRNGHLHSRSRPSGASRSCWICIAVQSACIPRGSTQVFMLYYLVRIESCTINCLTKCLTSFPMTLYPTLFQSWQILRKRQFVPSLHISLTLMLVAVIFILVINMEKNSGTDDQIQGRSCPTYPGAGLHGHDHYRWSPKARWYFRVLQYFQGTYREQCIINRLKPKDSSSNRTYENY